MNLNPNYIAQALGLSASLYEPSLSLPIVLVLVTMLGLTSFQHWLTHKSATSQDAVQKLSASLSSLQTEVALVKVLAEKSERQLQSASLSKLR